MILAQPIYLVLLLPVLLIPVLRRALRTRRIEGHSPSGPTLKWANYIPLTELNYKGLKAKLWFTPTLLKVLGLLLLVLAAARPQTEDIETLIGKGIDIMICLDMSGSMNAVDMPDDMIQAYHRNGREPPNRFDVARQALKELIKNRQGDRIGLVVFASDAYLKFPLTLDYKTVLEQLDGLILDNMEREHGRDSCINGCTIPGERTAIGDALARAYKRLEKSDAKGKVIVLITDGNDNASKLKPMDVAKYIGDLPDRIRPRLYTFLIGRGKYSKMPFLSGGRIVKRYGLAVYADYQEKVDEQKIRSIAEAAKGVFHVSYSEKEFRQAFKNLERTERKQEKIAKHKDMFPYFIFAGLGLLLLEQLLLALFFRRFP